MLRPSAGYAHFAEPASPPSSPPIGSAVASPTFRRITGSPKGVPIQTTLRIDGANCSACFNDVLESLRQAAGVRNVKGSISESLIEIDHADDVSLDDLADIARPHAHGIEMYANEIRMVPLEPTPCDHQHRTERPPTS